MYTVRTAVRLYLDPGTCVTIRLVAKKMMFHAVGHYVVKL